LFISILFLSALTQT